MKDRVLQMRRPDSTAARPYDSAPVPALNLSEEPTSELVYKAFETETPWTPEVSTLKNDTADTGVSTGFDLDVRTRDDDIVLEYSGLIRIPEAGTYTFYLQTDRGAVLRIHDATVIDADRGYQPGSEVYSEITLEEGLHPIRLTYARGNQGDPLLEVQWSGPNFSKQLIDPVVLRHRGGTE